MKVTIYKNPGPVTLEKFADQHGLEMTVVEMKNQYFTAYFKGVEVIKGRNLFTALAGYGKTPELAIADYVGKITSKEIVLTIGPSHLRSRISVPELEKLSLENLKQLVNQAEVDSLSNK